MQTRRDHVQRVASISVQPDHHQPLSQAQVDAPAEMEVQDNFERPPCNVQEHLRIAREVWPNMDLETRTSSF